MTQIQHSEDATASNVSSILPITGFLRLKQIIGDKKANPPIPALIPVSATEWWRGIRKGRYPKAKKIGPATTAWSAEDIRELIDRINASDMDFERGSNLTRARCDKQAAKAAA